MSQGCCVSGAGGSGWKKMGGGGAVLHKPEEKAWQCFQLCKV